MTIIGVNTISGNYEYGDNIHLCNLGHQTLESHSHAKRNQCKHFSVTLPWVSGLGWDRRGCVGEERRRICQAGIRVVFVHWAHREMRRGTAVCERVNVLWKKPRGFWTLVGISIIIQPAFFFFFSSSSLSLPSQSVAVSLLGVSDQCWHSQCSLLQCCLYWEISIPLIVEVCLCTEAWASILIQRPLCYAKTLSREAFILLLCTPNASFFQA